MGVRNTTTCLRAVLVIHLPFWASHMHCLRRSEAPATPSPGTHCSRSVPREPSRVHVEQLCLKQDQGWDAVQAGLRHEGVPVVLRSD
jgi:hypothetical protein